MLKGPRQAGKKALVKHYAEIDRYSYRTFDDLLTMYAAKSDPIGFIEDLEKPVILDEIQLAPWLFSTIKMDVDRNRVPGRYVLTGSADPLLMSQVSESLAGRMDDLRTASSFAR